LIKRDGGQLLDGIKIGFRGFEEKRICRESRMAAPSGKIADGGGRTHTPLRATDFESVASANSATSAGEVSIIARDKKNASREKNIFEAFSG
jgi:hypothetical protein